LIPVRLDRITPEGTKDLLLEEYEQIASAEKTLINIYKKSGYRGVRTPALEFFDVFSSGVGEIPQQEMYSFSDNKGRMMVLRPDSTKPVARLVSSRLKNAPMPLRLFYNQCVYKRNKSANLMADEIMQTGIELIGLEGKAGDIEALTVAAKALRKTCGGKFMLEIGHMGIYEEIISSSGFSEELKESVRQVIERKNYPALGALLESRKNEKAVFALLTLPSLYGKIEALERAENLFKGEEKIKKILNDIKNIYKALSDEGFSENIAIDLGLVGGYGYYSGLVFKGYAFGAREAVLSGGRYDTLYKDYGLDFPAVGFAIDTELLIKQKELKVTDYMEKPLTIALTKGRLEEKTKELFEKAGIDCSSFTKKGRKLKIRAGGLDVVFAKAGDVITYVEHGVCDMGIVGKDTIMEQGRSFYEMLDLGFGKCRFVLACKKGKDFYGGYGVKTVATKYPAVAANYFALKNTEVNIVKIDGSVELAPLLKLADGIVDITETGTTLKENGLEIKEVIAEISARLIVNTASLKTKKRQIENFIDIIKGNVV
jgi:ATP phosphoribosyltransferase regulatory subunit